ncbi:MAG: glycosyltransferase family 9 protein [Aquificaceae bacterium]
MDKEALIIRFSSLGDVVLSSCVIEPLISKGYRPHLLTFEPYGVVFEDDVRLKVIQVKKGKLFSKETLRNIQGFDLYLDLQKNFKTSMLRLLLKGKWKTYNKHSFRRRLSVYIESFRKPFSVVEAYLQSLGEKEGKPRIHVSQERLKKWKEEMGDNYISIGAGARYRKKTYPYFGDVCELLSKHGQKVVFVGDDADSKLVDSWKGINLCGKLSLVDTLAVIKTSKLFIGNDSGLLHMARAVGTKAIQIYGGTHPTLGFSLHSDEGKVLFKGLKCQPCSIHGKGVCKYATYECLDINPQEVVTTVVDLLRT